jgi:lactate permease
LRITSGNRPRQNLPDYYRDCRQPFPFFSIVLGWLGVFLKDSDTSANALFGTLQVITAKSVGVSPALMAVANSSGGTLGKMIGLQTIAIAAGATGLSTLEHGNSFALPYGTA